MGVVYKAEDVKLKRPVALKFLPPEMTRDAESKARFIREAQAASSLDHLNVCTIYEIDETEDRIFIAMGFIEGKSLLEKINEERLKIKDIVDLAIQIAGGLQAAHEHGIVHRDIKPANILITNDHVVKIVDFGLAKLSRQTKLTMNGTTLGTVAYMSPEQARGEEVDQRTDIWSLGAVLYEMLTGQRPFQGEYDQAVLYSIINDQPEPPSALRSGVPPELERIVLKMLAKDPAKRYQSVNDLLVDLTNLKESTETKVTADFKPANNSQKKTFIKQLIYAGIFILLIGAFFLVKHFVSPPPANFKPKPIAVISFENQTGDPQYDYLKKAIPNLLITKLEESECLRVASWERMYDLLRQLGKDKVQTIDRQLGFELCRLDSINTIVLGSFTKAGDIFATDVKVLDVPSKKLLKSASARGEGVGSILKNQIDELSEKIIKGMNIEESKGGRHLAGVADITTTSLQAYNYFLKARDAYYNLYSKEAQKWCLKALEYDSTFARAYFILALASPDGSPQQRVAFLKAKKYAYKAGKWRYLIEGIYSRLVEQNADEALYNYMLMIKRYPKEKVGYMALALYYNNEEQFEKAKETLEKLLTLDPDYAFGLNYLGYVYMHLGEFDKALKTLEHYVKLAPNTANPYDSMGDLYFVMGKLDAAISNYRQALVFKPDFASSWKLSYLYALKEKYAQAFQWVHYYLDHSHSPATETRVHIFRGFYNFWLGQYRRAIAESDSSLQSAQSGSSPFNKTVPYLIKSRIYYAMGNFEASRRLLDQWLGLVTKNHAASEHNFYLTAYNLSLAYSQLKQGAIDSARACLTKIETLLPKITTRFHSMMANYYNQILEAEILLAKGQTDRAIERAGTIQLENPRRELSLDLVIFYNLSVHRDILARVYTADGQWDNAIKQYERLMNRSAATTACQLIHPVYHYRLARLYEQKGWPGKAIEQYKTFLSFYRNADKGIKEVAKAKQRLSQLQLAAK